MTRKLKGVVVGKVEVESRGGCPALVVERHHQAFGALLRELPRRGGAVDAFLWACHGLAPDGYSTVPYAATSRSEYKSADID